MVCISIVIEAICRAFSISIAKSSNNFHLIHKIKMPFSAEVQKWCDLFDVMSSNYVFDSKNCNNHQRGIRCFSFGGKNVYRTKVLVAMCCHMHKLRNATNGLMININQTKIQVENKTFLFPFIWPNLFFRTRTYTHTHKRTHTRRSRSSHKCKHFDGLIREVLRSYDQHCGFCTTLKALSARKIDAVLWSVLSVNLKRIVH